MWKSFVTNNNNKIYTTLRKLVVLFVCKIFNSKFYVYILSSFSPIKTQKVIIKIDNHIICITKVTARFFKLLPVQLVHTHLQLWLVESIILNLAIFKTIILQNANSLWRYFNVVFVKLKIINLAAKIKQERFKNKLCTVVSPHTIV